MYALISILVLLLTAFAPAPFPRTTQPRVVTTASLTGHYDVRWGTIPCVFFLRQDSSYQCIWPGAVYVGSWGCRDGSLWISETTTPELPGSSQHYRITFAPGTTAGPVTHGADGVHVQMKRKLVAPRKNAP